MLNAKSLIQVAQSAGAVEYANCIFTDEEDSSHNKCRRGVLVV